jgi:hypothetical protein
MVEPDQGSPRLRYNPGVKDAYNIYIREENMARDINETALSRFLVG